MIICETNKIYPSDRQTFRNVSFCARKSDSDTVSFSTRKTSQEPNTLKKILKFFGIDKGASPADIEKAKEGFRAYQYQAGIVNETLRNKSTIADSISSLKKISNDYLDGKETEAFFVENGYDILSEPLAEDTKVLRYVYSSDDYAINWEIGDRVTEKGFMSTTSDLSENSYPKFYVTQMFENDRKYLSADCQFYTMEITIPEGTKVVKGDEQMSEVLLKYGTTFEITDFDPETNTYKCKII